MMALAAMVVVLIGSLLYPLAPASGAGEGSDHSRFSPSLTQDILTYVNSSDALDAVVVASGTEFLLEAGPTHMPINTHSVRKSIISVLFGMAVTRGAVDIESTLAEIGIDDAKMPLTEVERRAKISDLLKARSGIYIEAAGETAEMKAGRPRRGQYLPGEHYYYNNWDFNVLGSILSHVTGRTLHDYMWELSSRLGFQDYQEGHLFFLNASGSEHDQYVLYLSARDLARVGQMMLRDGIDKEGQSLIQADWIQESTKPYSALSDRAPLDAYGYLWSLDEDQATVWATGWGGQYLLIDRANELVVVVRNDTGRRLGEWLWLVALNNSTQGKMEQVNDIHSMLLMSEF